MVFFVAVTTLPKGTMMVGGERVTPLNSVAVRTVHKGQKPVGEGEDNRASYRHIVDHAFGRPLRAVRSPRTLVVKKARPKSATPKDIRNRGHVKNPGTGFVLQPSVILPDPKGTTTISEKLQRKVDDQLPTIRLEELRSMVLAKAKSLALLRAQDISEILPLLHKKPKEVQAEKSKWKKVLHAASTYKNDIALKYRHINQIKESKFSKLHASTDSMLNKEKLTQKLEEIGEGPVVETEPSTDMLHPSKDYRSAIFNRRSRVQEYKSRFDELAIKYLREATQKIDAELVKDMERLTVSYEAKDRAESNNAVGINNNINPCNSVGDRQLDGTNDKLLEQKFDAAKNISSQENTTINLAKDNSSLVPVPAQQHRVFRSDLISENVDQEMEKKDIFSMEQQNSDKPGPLLPAQYKKYKLNILNRQRDVDVDDDLDVDIQSLEQRTIERTAESKSRLPESLEQDWRVLIRDHVLGSKNLVSKEELAEFNDQELPDYVKKLLTEWKKSTKQTISKTQDIVIKEKEQETAAETPTPIEMAQSVIQTQPLDKGQQSVDQAQYMPSVKNDSSPCNPEEEKAKGDIVLYAQSPEENVQAEQLPMEQQIEYQANPSQKHESESMQPAQTADLIPTLSPDWRVSHRDITSNQQEHSSEKEKEETAVMVLSPQQMGQSIVQDQLLPTQQQIEDHVNPSPKHESIQPAQTADLNPTLSPDSWRVSYRDINGVITEFSLGEENLTLLQPPQTQPPHYFSVKTMENLINESVRSVLNESSIEREKREPESVAESVVEIAKSVTQEEPLKNFTKFYKSQDFGIINEKQETVGVAPTPIEKPQSYFQAPFWPDNQQGAEMSQDNSLQPGQCNKEILFENQEMGPEFETRSTEEMPERFFHASGLPMDQQGADQAQYLPSDQITEGNLRQSNQVKESEVEAQSPVEITKSNVQDHALPTDEQSTNQEQTLPSEDHSALQAHALSKDKDNQLLNEKVSFAPVKNTRQILNKEQSSEQAPKKNELSDIEDFSDVIVKKELVAETSLPVDMGRIATKAIQSPEQEPPPAQTLPGYLFLKDQEDNKEKKKKEAAVLGQSPVVMAQRIIQEQPLPKDPQSNDQSKYLPSDQISKDNLLPHNKELSIESQKKKPAVVDPSPEEMAQSIVQAQVLPKEKQTTHQAQPLPIAQPIQNLPSDEISEDNSSLPYNKELLIESQKNKPAVVDLSPVEMENIVQAQVLPKEKQTIHQAQPLPVAQPIKTLPSDQISEDNSSLPYNKELLIESQKKKPAVVDQSPVEMAQSIVQAQVLPKEKQTTHQAQPLPIAQPIQNLPSDEISEDNSSLPYNKELLIESQKNKPAVVDPSPVEMESIVQAQVLPKEKQTTHQAQPLPVAQPIKNLPSDQISEDNSSLPYNKELLIESQKKKPAVVDQSPVEMAQSIVQAQVLPKEKQTTHQAQPLPIAQPIKNLPSDQISEDNSSLPYNKEPLIESQKQKPAVVDPSPQMAQSVVQAQVLPKEKQNTCQGQPLPIAQSNKSPKPIEDTELNESLPLMELLRRVRERNRKERDSNDNDAPRSP